MIIRNVSVYALALALLPFLGGCVAQPQQETVQDTRLDQVVSQLDLSLKNQAAANAQLAAQQRELQKQGQNLAKLNAGLGEALKAPQAEECPKAEACPSVMETGNKMIVGVREDVWFPDLGLALTAKVDTGVATGSMDASEIKEFERDGKPWVSFAIVNPANGNTESVERRLVRTLGISSVVSAETKRRPVVRMGIVIGQNEQTAEFSLSSRTHKTYQIVIGRSILKDVMVVDVGKKHIAPYVLPKTESDSDGASK